MSEKFRIGPIMRKDDAELEQAISDLVARGFKLVKRGRKVTEKKEFQHRRHQQLKENFAGCTTFTQVWAILEK